MPHYQFYNLNFTNTGRKKVTEKLTSKYANLIDPLSCFHDLIELFKLKINNKKNPN